MYAFRLKSSFRTVEKETGKGKGDKLANAYYKYFNTIILGAIIGAGFDFSISFAVISAGNEISSNPLYQYPVYKVNFILSRDYTGRFLNNLYRNFPKKISPPSGS